MMKPLYHLMFFVTLSLCIHLSVAYLTSSIATVASSLSSHDNVNLLLNSLDGVEDSAEYTHNSHRSLEAKDTTTTTTKLIPLYRGYGTHFAWMFVGMPAQRQSLIIDTGGHYTAFPCSGCINCGSHTDEYWNPKNSTTVKISQCVEKISNTTSTTTPSAVATAAATAGSKCIITQSFVEGSGWKGYEVTDKVCCIVVAVYVVDTHMICPGYDYLYDASSGVCWRYAS